MHSNPELPNHNPNPNPAFILPDLTKEDKYVWPEVLQ